MREPLSIKGTKQYLEWFTTSHKKTVPKPHNVFIIVVADGREIRSVFWQSTPHPEVRAEVSVRRREKTPRGEGRDIGLASFLAL